MTIDIRGRVGAWRSAAYRLMLGVVGVAACASVPLNPRLPIWRGEAAPASGASERGTVELYLGATMYESEFRFAMSGVAREGALRWRLLEGTCKNSGGV